MLFKLGLKNLKHNLVMNILAIIQMSVAFVILISMISTIVSRFSYYKPIKEFLNGKGYFYNIQYGINPESNMTLRTTDELYSLVEDADNIVAQYNAWLNLADESPARFISYDDKYIELFTPELESGCWFDLDRPMQDTVQIVVSNNEYGIKVGDIISLFCMDAEIKAEVIGVLKNDTKIIDSSHHSVKEIDYRNLYNDYKLEREEKPVFLISQRELNDKPVVMQLCGNIFVKYPDSVSDEKLENGDRIMKQMHAAYSISTEKMKKNSLEYIFSQIYNLMPIFICILILTLIGAISTSALSAKYQLRNYAIYYICGLKWRQCTLVNLFSSLICVTISFVISLVFSILAMKTNILSGTVIELGIWQLLGCLVILLIYVLLSVILPVSIVGRNTPNQVLKSN